MTEPNIGHNSGETVGGIAGEALQQYVDRAERLIEERAALNADIKQVLDEAKATGFQPAIIRKILAIRAKDREAYKEEQELLSLYGRALGMTDIFS